MHCMEILPGPRDRSAMLAVKVFMLTLDGCLQLNQTTDDNCTEGRGIYTKPAAHKAGLGV